jgi:hypothetical protein
MNIFRDPIIIFLGTPIVVVLLYTIITQLKDPDE